MAKIFEAPERAALYTATKVGKYFPSLEDKFFSISKRRLEQRMEKEDNLEDILDTVFQYRGYGRYYSIVPLQFRSELKKLAEVVEESEPETVMEIGTAAGGTFYIWCRYLDSATKYISLDLPGGDEYIRETPITPGSKTVGGYTQEKMEFMNSFSDEETIFIRKNSHEESTLQEVQSTLNEDAIDFLFIDGDHTYDGVKQDFEMYRDLVSDGGIIAFHDIVNHNSPQVEVDRFWREIKEKYDTQEFIKSENQTQYGIGVVFI